VSLEKVTTTIVLLFVVVVVVRALLISSFVTMKNRTSPAAFVLRRVLIQSGTYFPHGQVRKRIVFFPTGRPSMKDDVEGL
jgi:hypothetical protein